VHEVEAEGPQLVAGVELLLDLAAAAGVLGSRRVGPCLEQPQAIGRRGGAPALDRVEGAAVVGVSARELGLGGSPSLHAQRIASCPRPPLELVMGAA